MPAYSAVTSLSKSAERVDAARQFPAISATRFLNRLRCSAIHYGYRALFLKKSHSALRNGFGNTCEKPLSPKMQPSLFGMQGKHLHKREQSTKDQGSAAGLVHVGVGNPQ